MILDSVHEEFERIDSNHYGYITRKALQDYARRTNQDADFVEHWMTWFDADKKGYITMEDVCTTLGIPMRKEYTQKVEEKRSLISQGIIPAPNDAPAVFAAPPQPKSKSTQLMDGVELLNQTPVKDGILEGCVRVVKDFPGTFKEEQEMARYLKEQMELRYKKYWQVVVASSTIGCVVGHEANTFIHFRYDNHLYILYRIPDPTSL